MKLFFICLCFLVNAFCEESSAQQRSAEASAIQPYVEFLSRPHPSPVEYVMDLFTRCDVVIFGERHHADMTQYDLVAQIIGDPRFLAMGGHVMTEVGSHNYTEAVNRVLCSSYADEQQFDDALLSILRDCEEQVLWTKSNFRNLLKTIWQVNRGTTEAQRVDITFLSPAWKWEDTEKMTLDDFETMEHATYYSNYDIIMGENAINALYRIFDTPRKKTLIILNVPHHLKYSPYWGHTAASCIMARFPGRVANIKINDAIRLYLPDETTQRRPPADGKWDAAFAATGNEPMGFDLAGSPFSRDGFDGYDAQKMEIRENVTYGEVFDGFIFYIPYPKIICRTGVPGLVNEKFFPEMLRRFRYRKVSEAHLRRYFGEDLISGLNRIQTYAPFDNESEGRIYDSIVNRHLITLE